MSNNGKETWLDKMFKELTEEVPTFTLYATDKDSNGLDTYMELGEASANIIKRDNKEQ